MPMYDYECEHCKQRLSIIRSITEHDALPSPEEEEGSVDSPVSYHVDRTPHRWSRILLGSPTVVKGAGWGYGRKGYW